MQNGQSICLKRYKITTPHPGTKPLERILVTGANGYIASQLIPLLLDRGYIVRCLVRDLHKLQSRTWISQVEVFIGDLTKPDSLKPALENVSQAFYLVHNMASGHDYIDQDIQAAKNFSIIARTSGIRHIIYLGGLADPEEKIARHMRSRIQSGEALCTGGIPVTEFRASLIIGPGSISFEMIRYLAEQFPLIIAPQWMKNLCQPISIQNITDYLLAALELSSLENHVYEIGGSDVVSYADSMLRYSQQSGKKRKILILPFNPVGILAYFMSRLTPVPATITRPLVEGLMSSSIVKDNSALVAFPSIIPMDFNTSLQTSLSMFSPTEVEPLWRQSFKNFNSFKHAGFCIQQMQIRTSIDLEQIIENISKNGKKWKTLGIDKSPNEGILEKQEDHIMQEYGGKLPGNLWREFQIKNTGKDTSVVITLLFKPNGAPGFLWWNLSTPIIRLILRINFPKIIIHSKISLSQ